MSALRELVGKLRTTASECNYDKEAFKKSWVALGFTGKSVLAWRDQLGTIKAVFKLIDSKKSASSNTVTALKNILKHEDVPFIAVFLDKANVRFRLMNSSLVRKVSHSSQQLTMKKIVGSINGSDILSEWAGIPNDERGLEELFALHQEALPKENLDRIVAATQGIQGRAPANPPDWELMERNLSEGQALLDETTLAAIEQRLFDVVKAKRDEILDCAGRTSPKAFGDCVERTILGAEPKHALGDIDFANGRVAVDIKARQVGRGSSPKAFNVQKLVDHLSAGPGAAFYLMVSVDVAKGTVGVSLINMLHKDLLQLYWPDDRWSGRNSLGTIALKGDVGAALNDAMLLELDVPAGIARLKELLGEKPGT